MYVEMTHKLQAATVRQMEKHCTPLRVVDGEETTTSPLHMAGSELRDGA